MYWLVVISGVAPSSGLEAPVAEMEVFWLMVEVWQKNIPTQDEAVPCGHNYT